MNQAYKSSNVTSGHVSPDNELGVLQEMFRGKIDPDVVHMVFTESDNNFDWSLDQLLQLSGEPATKTPSKTESTKLTMAEIAKQMSEKAKPWATPNGKSFVSKPMKNGVPFSAPKPGVKIPEEVMTALKDRKHVMIVMRGLPGSGKSTLAECIIRKQSRDLKTAMKLSADDFFKRNGSYNFNPSLLPAAHSWTQERAEAACREKKSLIVIDNTNIRAWEMEPYVAMAAKHEYWFLIVEPDTEWKFDATKCAKLNTHGVPVETIERMRGDYEEIDQFKLMEKYFPEPVLHQIKSQSRVSTPVKFDAETEVRPKSACGAVGGSYQSTSMDLCGSKAPNPDHSGQNPIYSGQNPIYSEQNPIYSGQNRARLNHIFGGVKIWDFPSFPCDPSPIIEVANPPNIIVCSNSSTQTSMRDFALLEALQDGTDILDISDEEVSIEEFSFEVEVPDTEVVKLDKGTDLPVLPGETVEEMVNGLKGEFGNLQEALVVEILKSCCFDREFATLVLKSIDPQHFDDFSWIHPEDVDGASDTSTPSDVTSASSWTEIDKPSLSMPFTMDIGFALDLQEEFGDIDGSPFDTLTFQLDKETCGSIYEAWKKALSEKKGKDGQKRRREATPTKKGNDTVCGPKSEFEEIVNYEMALEKSLRDVGDEEVGRDRETLHRAYPGIGKELLENVFVANGFNLKDTLEQVRSDQKAKNLLAKRTVNEACSRILCNKSQRSQSAQVSPLPPVSSSKKSEETRKRMKDLYNKQLDYMNRARECISSKKFAVASYYSEEAFKCQRMATRLITNSMTWTESNTLDLHELRVNDAMSALNEFMHAKRQQLQHSKNPRMTVDIITGWGSGGIPPKIKPAVQEYLKSNKLNFSQPNQGMFRVILVK